MSAIAAALEGPLALHHQQRAHNTRTQLFLILNLLQFTFALTLHLSPGQCLFLVFTVFKLYCDICIFMFLGVYNLY